MPDSTMGSWVTTTTLMASVDTVGLMAVTDLSAMTGNCSGAQLVPTANKCWRLVL